MEPVSEVTENKGFWERVNRNIKRIISDIKADSVAANPREPADCCNPPVTDKMKKKTGSPSH